MIKVGIVGCAGRMGQMLIKDVLDNPNMVLAGGVDRPGADAVGRDVAEMVGRPALGVLVGSDPRPLFDRADVMIDFTSPVATIMHAEIAAQTRTALVMGATGLDAKAMEILRDLAKRAPLLWSSNYSMGVNILHALVEDAAARLDHSYDIEIVEMHHRHKVDAPSGTALTLGQAAAAGRKVQLDQVARKSREGLTGERPVGEIGFATLRGGDVVGDHSVIFAGTGEILTLSHRATSRDVLSRGAVHAAGWLAGKPAGLYSMTDVLGLKARG